MLFVVRGGTGLLLCAQVTMRGCGRELPRLAMRSDTIIGWIIDWTADTGNLL